MKFWPTHTYKKIAPDYLDPETLITSNKEFGCDLKVLKSHLAVETFINADSCDLYARLHAYADHKLRWTGLNVEQFVIHARQNPNERQDYVAFTSIPVRHIEELFLLAHSPQARPAKSAPRLNDVQAQSTTKTSARQPIEISTRPTITIPLQLCLKDQI